MMKWKILFSWMLLAFAICAQEVEEVSAATLTNAATQNETETQSAVKAQTSAEIKSDAEDRIAEMLKSGNDPFQFQYNQTSEVGNQQLIPVSSSHELPDSILLKGVFFIEGRRPCALVQIGKNKKTQLVREGDLILLSQSSGKSHLKSKSMSDSSATYLLVNNIEQDCILVAPKKSPEMVITIR